MGEGVWKMEGGKVLEGNIEAQSFRRIVTPGYGKMQENELLNQIIR